MASVGQRYDASSEPWPSDAFRAFDGTPDLPVEAYEFHEEDGKAVFRAVMIAAGFCGFLLGAAIVYFADSFFGGSLIALALR